MLARITYASLRGSDATPCEVQLEDLSTLVLFVQSLAGLACIVTLEHVDAFEPERSGVVTEPTSILCIHVLDVTEDGSPMPRVDA